MRHHRNFKIVGPIKLPWAKMVVGVNEGVYVSICSDVMGMDKILAPKMGYVGKAQGAT